MTGCSATIDPSLSLSGRPLMKRGALPVIQIQEDWTELNIKPRQSLKRTIAARFADLIPLSGPRLIRKYHGFAHSFHPNACLLSNLFPSGVPSLPRNSRVRAKLDERAEEKTSRHKVRLKTCRRWARSHTCFFHSCFSAFALFHEKPPACLPLPKKLT